MPGKEAKILGGILPASVMLCACLQAILEMEGVDTSEFSEDVLACLPPTPWQISPSEISRRKDLRSLRSVLRQRVIKDVDWHK